MRDLNLYLESKKERSYRENLLFQSGKLFFSETINHTLRLSLLIAFFISICTLSLLIYFKNVSNIGLTLFTSLFVIELVLSFLVLRVNSFKRLYQLILTISSIGILCTFSWHYLESTIGKNINIDVNVWISIAQILTVLLFVLFPWDITYGKKFIIAVFGLLIINYCTFFNLYFPLITLILLPVASYLIYRNNFLRWYNISSNILINGSTGEIFGIALIRVMSWHLCNMFSAKKILLCFANRVEQISFDSIIDYKVDINIVKSIVKLCKKNSKSLDECIFKVQKNYTYQDDFKNLFGFLPKYILFKQFVITLAGQEENVELLFPIKYSIFLPKNLKYFFNNLTNIIKISLSALRLRIISSDVAISSEKADFQKENELNRIVHFVNNLVQNIVIQCDNLKQSLEETSIVEEKNVLSNGISQISSFARCLSERVIDLKWLREMKQIKLNNKLIQFPLDTIIADFSEYINVILVQRTGCCNINVDIPDNISITSLNRDFLLTSFRTLFHFILAIKDSEAPLEFNIKKNEENFIVFEFSYNGKIFSKDQLETDYNEWKEYFLSIDEYFKGCNHLLSFETIDSNKNTVSVCIPYVENIKKETNVKAWALFVEDNEQVLSFYEKVSEALFLKCHTASSIEEVKNIIDEFGEPNIVITDLQLAKAESGLEVVKLLRNKFKTKLPIIIVSGTPVTDDSFNQLEITKFLLKPVSRKKLFSEIKSLL